MCYSQPRCIALDPASPGLVVKLNEKNRSVFRALSMLLHLSGVVHFFIAAFYDWFATSVPSSVSPVYKSFANQFKFLTYWNVLLDMPRKPREGFEKASTTNLPQVSMFAVCKYINEKIIFSSVEGRGVKLNKSSRQSYGDQSVGFVEVKRRDDGIVDVFASVTPEHRVRSAPYTVFAAVNDKEDEIEDGKCLGCAASEGGCKHIVAFLFWLHRRSEEPSPTQVVAYWRKSALASVGSQKFMSLRQFSESNYGECPSSSSPFLEDCKKKCREVKVYNTLTSMSEDNELDVLSLHFLFFKYSRSNLAITASGLMGFAATKMTPALCAEGSRITEMQSNSRMWHELRYGRITASLFYEAANCSTEDGSLVSKILGASTFKTTEAMKRGIALEAVVLAKVAQKIGCELKKCGLLLLRKHPVFGASPDAVGSDFVVEVKCPISNKTKKTYITETGIIQNKYKAQINLQMYMYKVKKGLFVVAEPDFEKSGKFTNVWLSRDDEFIHDLLVKARAFWDKCIFPFFNRT